MKRLAVLILSSVLLTACASSGNSTLKNLDLAQIQQEIVEGQTTKAQIQAKYGSADNVTFTDGGNEIWTYRYAEATSHASNYIPIVNIFSSGQDVKVREMVLMFDRNNIVQRFTVRESNSVEKAGILGK